MTTDLSDLPPRMQRLPIDPVRGIPIPWFVGEVNGVPDFRAMDAGKWRRAVRERRCWVCGDILGAYLAFVVGPMCGLNRTTSEPPCHRECARWSAIHCPFLSNPRQVRRQDDMVNDITLAEHCAGLALPRNPGVTLIWTTRAYSLFRDLGTPPKTLIKIGEATSVEWLREGRPATRAEVEASIAGGLPAIEELAGEDERHYPGALATLRKTVEAFRHYYPPA